MVNYELDRFDNKILEVLGEHDGLNMSVLNIKTNNRENRTLVKKRLRNLEKLDLITFDDTNFRMSGYIIKLKPKDLNR